MYGLILQQPADNIDGYGRHSPQSELLKKVTSMRALYHLCPSALDDEHITKINDLARDQPAQDGTIFSSAEDMQSIRSSSIRWLTDEWLRDLLIGYIQNANAASFGVDLDDKVEIQFTEYHAVQNGHYDWHHDVYWNGQDDSDRKLSMTVQLSDPADYGGGTFEFDEVQTTADFTATGTILMFPSYLRHRVLPVTSGTRRSLVAWFSGPRWR